MAFEESKREKNIFQFTQISPIKGMFALGVY